MKTPVAGIMLMVCLVALPGAPASADGKSDQPKAATQRAPLDEIIREAGQLSASVEKTGARLLAILKDANEPSRERVRCAQALGRLKYLPALPELIARIDLHDEEKIISESAIDVVYPCVRAVAEYGTAAIADTVGAYMKEKDPDRQRLLATALALAKGKDLAIACAKGLATGSPDPQAAQKAQSLAEALK